MEQILVAVAIIQSGQLERRLKTGVEKASLPTVVEHGSVGRESNGKVHPKVAMVEEWNPNRRTRVWERLCPASLANGGSVQIPVLEMFGGNVSLSMKGGDVFLSHIKPDGALVVEGRVERTSKRLFVSLERAAVV